MNNFKKNNRFSGGGFNRGGERSFGRSGGRDFDQKQMHQATCADCKKPCEVPFKPNGMKPVYCKDCFAKNGGQVSGDNDFPKKSFKPAYNDSRSYPESRPSTYAPRPQAENNDRKTEGLSKQLEIMNAKFDKLISLTETLILKSGTKSIAETASKAAFVPAEKSEKVEKASKSEKKASKKNTKNKK